MAVQAWMCCCTVIVSCHCRSALVPVDLRTRDTSSEGPQQCPQLCGNNLPTGRTKNSRQIDCSLSIAEKSFNHIVQSFIAFCRSQSEDNEKQEPAIFCQFSIFVTYLQSHLISRKFVHSSALFPIIIISITDLYFSFYVEFNTNAISCDIILVAWVFPYILNCFKSVKHFALL